jgi:hypothetical protein
VQLHFVVNNFATGKRENKLFGFRNSISGQLPDGSTVRCKCKHIRAGQKLKNPDTFCGFVTKLQNSHHQEIPKKAHKN